MTFCCDFLVYLYNFYIVSNEQTAFYIQASELGLYVVKKIELPKGVWFGSTSTCLCQLLLNVAFGFVTCYTFCFPKQ